MNRSQFLALYMALIFGPLLNVTLDLAILYTHFFEPPYPHASVLRYVLSLLYTGFVYISWLPLIQWSLAQENFQSGPWQLSVQTVFLFSVALPLPSTLCTEFSMIALSVQDPFLSTRFYMVPPISYFLLHLLDVGNILSTYREAYLLEFH